MTDFKTTKQWTIAGKDGFSSLKFGEKAVPELGDSEVLVQSEYNTKCHLKPYQLLTCILN